MMKRWAVVCRDCDGQEHARHLFTFRASARRFASTLGGELSLCDLLDQRAAFTQRVNRFGPQHELDFHGIPRTFTVEIRRAA